MKFSISQARSALNSGDYEDALLNYMTVLRVASITRRVEYLDEVMNAFKQFLSLRRPEHQIHILLMALCEIYKEDVAYLQRIADGLAIQGEYLSSATVFRKAIALSQSPECRCSPTERIGLLVNVDHINSLLFDAWHWQMLNSKIRNEAFANAICKVVERFSNPVILDIGCGSGILSIVSARTKKAKKIIACDYSETMCSISSKVGVLNDLNSLTDFELYPIHSCDLELQQRADILVSETVDSAIFGENILSTIQDAQDRLLKEESIVIPSKATLYFAALESPDIATRSSCELGDIVILSTNCFSHYNLESKVDSGYTCAHLAELTHGYNILSELIEAISVNFNDRHQVELLNSGTFRANCKLRIIKGGVINGITSWFKLYTYENISISSSPASHSSWQQAIWPVYPPLIVQANETVEIELFLKEGAQLIAMPISQPKVAKELLRVHGTNRFDFPALNDLSIREFFKKAIGLYKNLLDLTDLFLFRHIDSKNRITKVKTKNSLVQRLAQPDQLELDDFVPDAILFWPVSTRGWLSDEKITELLECASYWPKAVIIPTEIVLNGYLFSSDDLCSRSRLSEGQHLGIDLTPMDEFKSTWLYEISPQRIPHKRLSNPMQLLKISFEEPTSIISNLNQIRVSSNFHIEHSCQAHGLLCWFKVSHGSVSQELSDGNFQASAFFFDKPLELKEGEDLNIFTSIFHSSFVIEVE